ncbi:hypothetical protein [Streptomyces sp. ODS28]|uniref:hypothetical protein n=1 Tax=Streptomyces sp. ODS28 TaxID=3136688 RepID=UPI0031EDDDD8
MRLSTRHGAMAAVGCAALVATLTAASPPQPRQPGGEMAGAARAQLDSVPSVRLHMTSGDFSLRLALDEHGNCAGDVDMADQGRVKLVKRGGTVWLAPDAAFWRAQVGGQEGELLAQGVKGRYMKGASESPDKGELTAILDTPPTEQA